MSDDHSTETGAGNDGRESETIPHRVGASRAKLWVLIEADRWLVTGVVLAGVFASLLALGAVDPSPLRSVLSDADPIGTLFQAYVAATITGVTLVVTINQLVLSQELGAVGDQRSRMEGAIEFREDVEDALDADALSADPSSFLQALVEGSVAFADDLIEAAADAPADARDDVEALCEVVTAGTAEVSAHLEDARFGTFAVISAVLGYDYSRKLHRARRVRSERADALPEDALSALDRLVETLELFGPAREHFKTLYFQWELINLSRAILYASVPAIVTASATILYLDTGAVTGTVLGVDLLVWVVAAASTVALAPFALLLSYVLRIATVAKRTLAIGPFILRKRGDSEGADG